MEPNEPYALETLGTTSRERIAIIGSGGKTTLMKRLALAAPGRALLTTTTHLMPPHRESVSHAGSRRPPEDYPAEFIPFNNLQQFRSAWEARSSSILTARSEDEHHHLRGLTEAEINELATLPDLTWLICEADGSRGLPIKAHASHEPALFSSCTLGIAVMGMQALGRPLIEGQVHRPELLRLLLGYPAEHQLIPADLARAALAYLRQFQTQRRALVLSQAEHCSYNELQDTTALMRELLLGVREPWAQHVPILWQRL